MRQLTTEEKSIVKKLVDRKKASTLEKLRTSSLLQDNLDCFAIRWDLTSPKKVIIYVDKDNKESTDRIYLQYFKICDFLYFMDELCDNHYIKLQTISFPEKKGESQHALYDRTKYQYGFPEGMVAQGSADLFFEKEVGGKRLYPINQIEEKAYTDCVDLLEKYHDKIIYPLPLLEDLVNHEYKSIEKRQFDEQMCWTRLSVFIASIALILTALFEGFDSQISIDGDQLKRAKQVIVEYNTDVTDTIHIGTPDTSNNKAR